MVQLHLCAYQTSPSGLQFPVRRSLSLHWIDLAPLPDRCLLSTCMCLELS